MEEEEALSDVPQAQLLSCRLCNITDAAVLRRVERHADGVHCFVKQSHVPSRRGVHLVHARLPREQRALADVDVCVPLSKRQGTG